MKISLKMKLIAGFLMAALMVAVVGIIGWNGMSRAMLFLDKLAYTENTTREILRKEIDHFKWRIKAEEFKNKEDAVSLGVQIDDHKCNLGLWYYSDKRKVAENEIPTIAVLLTKLEEPHHKLHSSIAEVENLLVSGERNEAKAFFQKETLVYLEQTLVILESIVPLIEKNSQLQEECAKEEALQIKRWCAIGSVVGMVTAVFFGLILSFSISRFLNHSVVQIDLASENVSTSSSQIAKTSQHLADGASEQAAAVEEISASVEEISSMTKRNLESVKDASLSMRKACTLVSQVEDSMQELGRSMENINGVSLEIGGLAKVNEGIAFQTNLLALNAAVEAARAGDVGAGFAVVADEVRNLAKRADEAAKGTTILIIKTAESVKAALANLMNVRIIFCDVAKEVDVTNKQMEQIESASEEQFHGFEQINQALAEVDGIIQSAASKTSDAAEVARKMNGHSDNLGEVSGKLKTFVTG
ncbi:MAG: methyl-accepting chemotaxis protein [Candidatus Moraniibacteriota bacterium]|jgi:methyl-accepting chemotaxis protein